MGMDLYIYYRVRTADADTYHRKAIAMQQMLKRQYGITAALKRRPDAQDSLHTWMEVYTAVPTDFAGKLQQAVDENGLAAFIDGPRHTEQFVDLSTCV